MTKAIEFRQMAGLNSDPAYVANVESNAQNPRTYGVALTPAEESEMARRGAISDSIRGVLPQLQTDASFGGVYIDQRAGGVVDLAVTASGSSAVGVVQSVLPNGTSLRVRAVNYSYADLYALKDRVTTEMGALATQGIQVTSVAVDIPDNRVEVGVRPGSADAGAPLRGLYGDAIVVDESAPTPTPATCTPSNCGNPLKGGLSISGGGQLCTSGYFQKISGTLYLVTAGHCLVAAGGTGIPWYHTSLIGYATWFQSAGTADAGGITSSETGAKNVFLEYVFGQHNYYSTATLTGWVAGTSQTLGSYVCKAGQTTGWTCGSLLNVDMTEGNRYHLNEVGASSLGGDSGGTVVGPANKLYGETSLSDGAGGHTWYVPPDRVDSFFGGTPCVTSTC